MFIIVFFFLMIVSGCRSELNRVELLQVGESDTSLILRVEMKYSSHQPNNQNSKYEFFIIKDFETYQELELSYYSKDFFDHNSLVYLAFSTPYPREHQTKSVSIRGKGLVVEVEEVPSEDLFLEVVSHAFYKLEVPNKNINDILMKRTDGW